jgi:solute carrier family 44 (choline transporter-like protein), member 2/4/5
LQQTFQLVYEDLLNCYLVILIALTIALIVSFLWTIILRFLIKPLIYISILSTLAVLAFGTYFCVQEYIDLKNKKTSENNFEASFQSIFDLDYVKNLKETWLTFSIILGLIFLVLLLITIFLFKRIKMAAELIKEVSKAVVKIPASIFWPIIPVILQIGCIAYCFACALYIASSGIELFKVVNISNYSISESTTTTTTTLNMLSQDTLDFHPFIQEEALFSKNTDELTVKVGDYCELVSFNKLKDKYKASNQTWEALECYYYTFGFSPDVPIGYNVSETTKAYYSKAIEILNDYQWLPQIYIIFMFFWLMAFVNGLNEMTVAGAFGAYYWTRYENVSKEKKNKLPFLTILGSFMRALFYHFGTIAFGSLLIATISIIRVILEFIHHKIKKHEDTSKIAKYFMCMCKCCFCCLERFIKFINRYAFIITAVYSLNFCRAAGKAFKLITSNAVRIVVIDKISNFILFLSNVTITSGIGVLSFYFFTKKLPVEAITKFSPDLNFYVL